MAASVKGPFVFIILYNLNTDWNCTGDVELLLNKPSK